MIFVQTRTQSKATSANNALIQEFERLLEENLAYAEKVEMNRAVIKTLSEHIKALETDALTAKAQEALKARQVQKSIAELEEITRQVKLAWQQTAGPRWIKSGKQKEKG